MMALVLSVMASNAAIAEPTGVTVNPGSEAGTQSTGGHVHFTGAITDTSCDIDTSSTNLEVDLGKWSSRYFTGAGTETTKTPFHIKVKDCPESVKTVAVLFDGNHDNTDKDLLAINPGEGAASGVAVQLLEEDETTPIGVGQISQNRPVVEGEDDKSGSADLTFYANYKATTAEVKSGEANAVANFNMIYN
jgi:major type 1 subunit fimbrin (pilin)